MVKEEKIETNQNTETGLISDDNPYGYCIELIKYNVILEKDGYFSWTPYLDKETFEKEKVDLEGRVVQEGVAPSFAEYYCRIQNRENGFI